MVRCLVTGSTGYVGSRLIPALLDRGHAVRAMARDPDKLAGTPWRADAEVVRADLMDPESLIAACRDVDVVYYLVHSMGTSDDFEEGERRSAQHMAAAARAAGVRRLVYLGGLHPSDKELSPHLRSRATVGKVLLDADMETVVLQAGIIVGWGSASFEMIRHLTDLLPVMTAPRWVHNKIQPIAISDVLHYLVEAAVVEVPESRAWDIGGPDVFSYGQLLQIYGEVAGLRRRRIVGLPFLTPWLASWWVGLVTPLPSDLARPLVESLECDAIMGDHDIDAVIAPPAHGLTSYRDAVSLVLQDPAQRTTDDSSRTPPWQPLPTDPPWAGEVTYELTRSDSLPESEDKLWSAITRHHPRRGWRVEECEKPVLRLQSRRGAAGHARLDIRARADAAHGSRYDQRLTFYPRGLIGHAYWYGGFLLHRYAFRRASRTIAHAARTSP